MSELHKAIEERRTVRKFKSDPVPMELIEKILKAGMWAPSDMNTQPWKFYVFMGNARDKIVSILSKSIEGLTPRLRELFTGWSKLYIAYWICLVKRLLKCFPTLIKMGTT